MVIIQSLLTSLESTVILIGGLGSYENRLEAKTLPQQAILTKLRLIKSMTSETLDHSIFI